MNKKLQLISMVVAISVLMSACSGDKSTSPAPAQVPTVSTATVSAISHTTAQCGGTIVSDGGAAVTACGVCWSTNATPSTADNKTTDGVGSVTFTSALSGLTPGMLYYVRAYATNGSGTGYGSADSFTTTVPVQIRSSFDTDGENWTVSGGGIFYAATGGNPGGYVEFEDQQDGAGVFVAPARFTGDLSEFNQGTVSFDLVNRVDNAQPMLWGYGMIRITAGALYAEKNVVPADSFFVDWTSFSVPLNAVTWGVSAAQWDSILTGVTEIRIQMDAQWDYFDRTGLDNFAFTAPTLVASPASDDRRCDQ